jgi:hypothetical protein
MKISETLRVIPLHEEYWQETAYESREEILQYDTFDDEGAEYVFTARTWKDLDVQSVLKHPTAHSFLKDEVFVSVLPGLIGVVYWENLHANLKEDRGRLADHLIADLKHRWSRLRNNLSADQKIEVHCFVDKFGYADELTALQ